MDIRYLAARISEPVLDSIGQISSGKDSSFPSSMNEKTKPETLQLEKFCPRARPSEKYILYLQVLIKSKMANIVRENTVGLVREENGKETFFSVLYPRKALR